jgi:3-oxoacyl-[acyl-carrier protein] reductase
VHSFGPIDIVVANAGGGPYVSHEDPDESWLEAFQLNLMASVRLARLTLPHMQKQRRGRFIAISSVWGREAGGAMSYNATKAALISFTRNLAIKVAKDGVTVNCVCPGSIMFPGGGWDIGADRRAKERGITREAWIEEFVAQNFPGGRFGTPEEVANLVTFLASEQASWINGAIITVDGCQSRSGI